MARIWLILAGAAAIVALALFWFYYFDAAFVVVVVGCVAFLLDFRGAVRKRCDAHQATENE